MKWKIGFLILFFVVLGAGAYTMWETHVPHEHVYKDGKVGLKMPYSFPFAGLNNHDLMCIVPRDVHEQWIVQCGWRGEDRNDISTYQQPEHVKDGSLPTAIVHHWRLIDKQPWYGQRQVWIYFYPEGPKADRELLRRQLMGGHIHFIQHNWKVYK